MRVKQVVAPSMLAVLFAAVIVQLPLAIVARASDYEFFDPIIDIRHLLMERYVEPPDMESMHRGMIEGMLDTLDDPHTLYVPPERLGDFNKDLRGTYVGIGAEVSRRDDYLLIVTPLDGSPALAAGVKAGDLVLTIDGVSTFQKEMSECIDLLVGEPGTRVTVTVRHADDTEEELTIVRDHIVTRTVRGLRRLGEEWSWCLDDELDIAYVRVTQFNHSTIDELKEVLDELQRNGLNALVLDLRDNPGGELEAAVGMADLFLESGVILSIRDRDGRGPTFEAGSPDTLPDFPMIVMINEASASASEIVSGALQQAGRARVLGTRSHGKGSVQEVHQLPLQGGTLKITTAYYHLADGSNIHRRSDSIDWGVDPDPGMLIRISDEAYFDHLEARHDYEIIRDPEDGAETCPDSTWIREKLKDDQLARAVELLQDRLDGQPWPAPSEELSNDAVALDARLQRAFTARAAIVRQLNEADAHIEELQKRAEEAGVQASSLADVDLLAGTMTIRDRHGNVVGEFRIDGGNVVAALETIDLSPLKSDR